MGLESKCCCGWALPGSRDQITHRSQRRARTRTADYKLLYFGCMDILGPNGPIVQWELSSIL